MAYIEDRAERLQPYFRGYEVERAIGNEGQIILYTHLDSKIPTVPSERGISPVAGPSAIAERLTQFVQNPNTSLQKLQDNLKADIQGIVSAVPAIKPYQS